MTCETARAALLAAGQVEWRAAAQAHLGGCENCAIFLVEWTLQQAPPVEIPATFAIDVARRARLEARPASRSSALIVGLTAAIVLLAGAGVAWFVAPIGPSAALPAAALLLACGEAIVLAAWSLDTDLTRTRWRR
jgi:hypothetical protein